MLLQWLDRFAPLLFPVEPYANINKHSCPFLSQQKPEIQTEPIVSPNCQPLETTTNQRQLDWQRVLTRMIFFPRLLDSLIVFGCLLQPPLNLATKWAKFGRPETIWKRYSNGGTNPNLCTSANSSSPDNRQIYDSSAVSCDLRLLSDTSTDSSQLSQNDVLKACALGEIDSFDGRPQTEQSQHPMMRTNVAIATDRWRAHVSGFRIGIASDPAKFASLTNTAHLIQLLNLIIYDRKMDPKTKLRRLNEVSDLF
ncbi:unnamed protein product [Protopolystoma xenopodis]|uniref:Uncharacterized protein n=1 Tax=Protopolystoma xenopodis TaxID=117903 RepID=A0A448WQ30_9PLAT|nr:unnamed protein product [Protopolystoma xenopodis]